MLKFEHINEIVARCVRAIFPLDEKDKDIELSTLEKNMVDRLSSVDALNKEIDLYRSIDEKKAYDRFFMLISKGVAYRKIRKTIYYSTASAAAAIIALVFILQVQNKPVGVTVVNPSAKLSEAQVILKTDDGKEYATSGDVKVSEKGVIASEKELLSDNARQPAVNNTLITSKGIRQKITLSDGTVVWLNSETQLTFPTTFIGAERTVTLSGEAYFDVTHSDKPFIVKNGQNSVRVYGTTFCVTSYPDIQSSDVALYSGSVQVSTPIASVMLQPGFKVEIDNRTNKISPQVHHAFDSPDWMRGRMEFYSQPLYKVLNSLERWYGIDSDIEASIMNKEITIMVSDKINLQELIDLLNTTQNLSVTQQSNKIIIKKK